VKFKRPVNCEKIIAWTEIQEINIYGNERQKKTC
jgi:hypothetical protein